MTADAPADVPIRLRIRAARLALIVGVVVLCGKLLAWWITGSAAVFSDAAESVVNVAAAGLLLYSVYLSSLPPDRNHPYGHGKIEFFSAGVEGGLIGVAALLIVFEAGRDLVRGPRIERIDLGLGLMLVFTAVNAGLGLHLLRIGRRAGSLALEADGRHLLTDVQTSVGVVGGLIAVRVTGIVLLDPLVAILVALNLLRTGWRLSRQAVGGLMDEADEERLAGVVAALARHRRDWWIDVHALRTWASGPHQHADLHLRVPRYFDAVRLHAVNGEIEAAVREGVGSIADVIVHFDPCAPDDCPGCGMPDCPVRGAPSEGRRRLTLERSLERV